MTEKLKHKTVPALPTNAIQLGTGELCWSGGERRSDRYGAITLTRSNRSYGNFIAETSLNQKLVRALVGNDGTLFAKVLETRESQHIGDLFRSIFPSTPDVGEIVVLGTGIFFYEEQHSLAVGLRPPPLLMRGHDWLDPEALYRVHEQTVEVWFAPEHVQS